MRILQLGDTHLGRAGRAWKAPPGWSRGDDHQRAFATALGPALREQVDLVVHTGDLFDRSRPPPRAVAQAAALLAEVARRVPVVVLAGNHDRRGLRVHLGEGAENLHVVDVPTRLRVAGLALGLVPHFRQAADWAAAARAAAGPGVDALVAHQGVDGARVPGFTFRPGRPAETVGARHLPPGVRRVLSGHLHPRQAVRCGEALWLYAGSTERTAFSEAPQAKGHAIWAVESTWRWRFVDGPARPMVRVRDEADLDRVEPGALVGMAPQRLRQWAGAAAARGGLVALPPDARTRGPSRQQQRLF